MGKKRFVRGFAVSTMLLATLVGFVAWSNIFYAPNTHALAKGDASPTDIMKKALTHNMRICYDWYYMHTPLRSDKAKMGDGQNNNIFNMHSKEDLLPIPTLVGNTIKDGNVSCAQSVAGYSKSGQKLTGLLSLFGKPDFDGDGTGTNMVAIGYTPVPKEDDQPQAGKHTFTISYNYQDTINNKLGDSKSGSISATFGANGELISSPDACYESNGTPKSSSKMFCIDNLNSSLQVFEGKLWGAVNALSYRGEVPYTWLAAYQISVDEGKIDFSGIPSWHQLQTDCADQAINDVSNLDNGLTVGNVFYACSENTSRKFSDLKVEYKFEADDSQAITREEFEITDFEAARQHFISYLGAGSYDGLWTANEKFTVYYSYYIARVKNDNKSNGYLSVDESSCLDSLNPGILATGNSYYLPHNGKWCKVNIDDKLIVQHKTVASDEGQFAILTGLQTKMTSGKDAEAFREVVRELMQIHDLIDISGTGEIGDVPEPDPTPVDPNPDPSPEGDDETTPTCYNSSSSLSWILCPVLNTLAVVTEGVYEYAIAPSLEVQAGLVGDDTRSVWKEIRNYANIAFVIVFLVVIFSQVTGIGLDNYNIKKILPKLIIVAVLVNLSFILCQIAVDVSNIVGASIYNLFESISIEVPKNTATSIGSFAKGVAAWVTTGAVAFAGINFLIGNQAIWVVPLILYMIGAVISVLFFAILLGIRKAGIVILVVLAPIAIVCYALPNTKKFFDRWFKIFSSLLMLYPICGALVGGGEFASKLLLKVGHSTGAGFFFQLVAMLVQIVPVFFIPVIVRSSFQAMGNLGNRLLGLRDRFSRGATGAIRGTEATKDWQQRMAGRDALRRVNRFQENRDLRGRLARGLNRIHRGDWANSLLNSDARNRAQTRAINAAGAYMLANQIADQTAEDGMEGIKSRQSAQLLKHFMDTYDNDADFKADLDKQGKAYNQALDELEADPESQEARAKVRALQKFIGATADGQDKIKEVMYKRLYNEQQTRGHNARVSRGMQFAAQTLVAENGGAFKSGDRGFSKAMKEMARGENSNVFNGQFREVEHRNEQGEVTNRTYHNDAYGAESWKADASNLANANDTALADALAAINSGTMSANEIEDIYRNASDALANENIHVKSENETALNQIRRAAHNAMASSTSLYDTNGRLFNREANGQYKYVDDSNVEHLFTRAADGSLVEQGGSGMTVAADHIMTASDRFSGRYGSTYSDVHTGDSFKVQHNTPQARAHVALPPGVRQRPDGTYINIATGSPLTGTELQRAQAITRANIEADIYNAQNGLTPPNP